jgi:hypothetical protein
MTEHSALAAGYVLLFALAISFRPDVATAILECVAVAGALGLFLGVTQVRRLAGRLRAAPAVSDAARTSAPALTRLVVFQHALVAAVGALLVLAFGRESASLVAGALLGVAVAHAWASLVVARLEDASGNLLLRATGRWRFGGSFDPSDPVRVAGHPRRGGGDARRPGSWG